MRLGYDRIANITHKIVDSLWRDEMIDFKSEEKVVNEIRNTIKKYLEVEEEIDGFVRRKIASLSRNVHEGSSEYNLLYQKYFEEEIQRRNW